MSKDAKGAFNGADESKFDHDKSGAPGGSVKAVPAVDAQAEAPAPLSEDELRAKIVAELQAEAAAKAEAEREARIAEEAANAVAGQVKCRVLPKGDGEIFTGEHRPAEAEKFPTYKRGDVFWIARDIAQAQEDAGRVEIVG